MFIFFFFAVEISVLDVLTCVWYFWSQHQTDAQPNYKILLVALPHLQEVSAWFKSSNET